MKPLTSVTAQVILSRLARIEPFIVACFRGSPANCGFSNSIHRRSLILTGIFGLLSLTFFYVLAPWTALSFQGSPPTNPSDSGSLPFEPGTRSSQPRPNDRLDRIMSVFEELCTASEDLSWNRPPSMTLGQSDFLLTFKMSRTFQRSMQDRLQEYDLGTLSAQPLIGKGLLDIDQTLIQMSPANETAMWQLSTIVPKPEVLLADTTSGLKSYPKKEPLTVRIALDFGSDPKRDWLAFPTNCPSIAAKEPREIDIHFNYAYGAILALQGLVDLGAIAWIAKNLPGWLAGVRRS